MYQILWIKFKCSDKNRSDLPDENNLKQDKQQMMCKQKYFDHYTDGPSVPVVKNPI